MTSLFSTFDIMIKPILLFSSEMWGYMMKENSKNEKALLRFCKHILGVHRNATNCAVLSELGVYPLKIDSQVSMINFFLYLQDTKNEILAELIPEMERIDSEWLAYNKAIINQYILNVDRYKKKTRNQMPENELSKEFCNSKRLKRELRSKSKQRYESNWKIKMQESSKLEF